MHPAQVCPLSLFILLIHKLGPEGAAFQTGKPPAAVGSSLPTCQSPFSPGATPSLSGGGVDISGILPSTPKLFIFILSWHFNTPPCRLSDPLPKTSEERKQQLPSDTCQLEARGWMWGPDGTEGRNGARREGGCQMGFVLFGREMLNGSLTVFVGAASSETPPPPQSSPSSCDCWWDFCVLSCVSCCRQDKDVRCRNTAEGWDEESLDQAADGIRYSPKISVCRSVDLSDS